MKSEDFGFAWRAIVYAALLLLAFSQPIQAADSRSYNDELARCTDLLPWGPPRPRDAYTHLVCARGPNGRQPAIAMGYSADTLTGVWSSYGLNRNKLRRIATSGLSRDSDFHRYGDNHHYGEIPQPNPRGGSGDYAGSGYDRGRLAPNGNMKWSQASVTASLYITNIAPQDPAFNREAWRCLEQSVQSWARAPGDTFVTVGVIFPENDAEYIGHEEDIEVPSYFYMVVYRRPAAGDVADAAVAKLMPNEKPQDVRTRRGWDRHMDKALRSVDELEQITKEMVARYRAQHP